MSFDWNLSSDEEDGFDDWANTHSLTNSAPAPRAGDDGSSSSSSDDEGDDSPSHGIAGMAFGRVAFGGGAEDDNVDDDESIGWEDAEEEAVGGHQDMGDDSSERKSAADETPPSDSAAASLRPVTVDINIGQSKGKKDDTRTKNSKKKRARRRYRFDHLPRDMQRFLSNVEKSHLLSMSAHAQHLSRHCSSPDLLHIANSLIDPYYFLISQEHGRIAPTFSELTEFCQWYFDLVHRTEQRRREATMANRRAGAAPPARSRQTAKRKLNGKHGPSSNKVDSDPMPSDLGSLQQLRTVEYCSYLSRRHDEDPQLMDPQINKRWPDYDRVFLFIAMARSLGWRARLVVGIEPLQKDLDVNHPLLVVTNVRNIFRQVWKDSKRPKKETKASEKNVQKPVEKRAKLKSTGESSSSEVAGNAPNFYSKAKRPTYWVEILITKEKPSGAPEKAKNLKWIHVDPSQQLINRPDFVEALMYAQEQGLSPKTAGSKKTPIAYALGVEHVSVSNAIYTRFTDITPRYSSSWVDSLKKRGVIRGKQTRVKESERVDQWWIDTLKLISGGSHHSTTTIRKDLRLRGKTKEDAIHLDIDHSDDENDKKPAAKVSVLDDNLAHIESMELKASAKDEPIPNSKTAFQAHPIYAIPSVLKANEVLVPDARKRMCGVFKGEFVYRRTDIKEAFAAEKWLYRGRKVKEGELQKPIKQVKARKKAAPKSFKALKSYGVGKNNDGTEEARLREIEKGSKPLEDGMEDVYAPWQTDPWSPPPVGPDDRIPTNKFRNVELELLNPGLVHVNEHRIAAVAKQIGM